MLQRRRQEKRPLSRAYHASSFAETKQMDNSPMSPIVAHTEKKVFSCLAQTVALMLIFATALFYIIDPMDDEEAQMNQRHLDRTVYHNITSSIFTISFSWFAMIVFTYYTRNNESAFGVGFAFFAVLICWCQIVIFQSTMKSIKINFGDEFRGPQASQENALIANESTVIHGVMNGNASLGVASGSNTSLTTGTVAAGQQANGQAANPSEASSAKSKDNILFSTLPIDNVDAKSKNDASTSDESSETSELKNSD